MSIMTTSAQSINPDPIDLPGFPTFAEVSDAMSMEGQRRDHRVWALLNGEWDRIAWGSTCYAGAQQRRQEAYEAAAREMARWVPPAPPACCDASEPTPCQACIESDPETWDASVDDYRWEPTEADRIEANEAFLEMDSQLYLDASETLTLLELAQRQRDFYLSWKNATGSMFADLMAELMSRIEVTGASSPAELDARLDAMDRDARDRTYRAGFDAAMAECRSRGAMASPLGHTA